MNPFPALRAYLGNVQAVTDLVDSRIFAIELPEELTRAYSLRDDNTPDPMILLRARPAAGIGDQSRLNVRTYGIDTLAYSKTPFEAHELDDLVDQALMNLERFEGGGVFVHTVNRINGPLFLRDPDFKWPRVITSWDCILSSLSG